jgi:hypothetical protein
MAAANQPTRSRRPNGSPGAPHSRVIVHSPFMGNPTSASPYRAVHTRIPAAITMRLIPSPSRKLGGSRNIFSDTT